MGASGALSPARRSKKSPVWIGLSSHLNVVPRNTSTYRGFDSSMFVDPDGMYWDI